MLLNLHIYQIAEVMNHIVVTIVKKIIMVVTIEVPVEGQRVGGGNFISEIINMC